LARYVHAWERADVDELVKLLHADATLAMPPMSQWLHGPAAIGISIAAMVFGPVGAGGFRLVPTRANGLPAFAAYKRGDDGMFHAFALHVLELESRERIGGIVAFLDPRLFAAFGLPAQIHTQS
jgi:RNA polymerase sigma-70 factor (ECF subfamily)